MTSRKKGYIDLDEPLDIPDGWYQAPSALREQHSKPYYFKFEDGVLTEWVYSPRRPIRYDHQFLHGSFACFDVDSPGEYQAQAEILIEEIWNYLSSTRGKRSEQKRT